MDKYISEQEKHLCRCLVSLANSHPFCKKETDRNYDDNVYLSPHLQVTAIAEALNKYGIECDIEYKIVVIPNTVGAIVPALSLKGWTLGLGLEEKWEDIAQNILKNNHPDVSVRDGIWTISHNLDKEARVLAMQENEGRVWIMPAKVDKNDERPRHFRKVVNAMTPIVSSFLTAGSLNNRTPQVKQQNLRRRTI